MARRFSFKPPPGTPVVAGHPLAFGLVGAWELSEGGGLVARDSSGRYGPGTLTNTPVWGTGGSGVGSELQFTAASTQYVNVPNNPTMSLNRGDGNAYFTAMVRFRMNSLRNYNALFTNQTSNLGVPFDMYVDSGGTLNGFAGGGVNLSGFVANVWYTVAISAGIVLGSFAFGSILYVDGVQRNTGGGNTFADPHNAINIGTRTDHVTLMDGSIAFARLWNRPLSAAEVQDAYVEPYGMYRQPRLFRGFLASIPSTPANVTAVKMTATAAMVAPTITGGAGLTAVAATATALLVPPTVTADASITAVKATAAAAMIAPAVEGGVGVTAVPMTATAAMLAPAISGGGTVEAVPMTATAAMLAPAVQGDTSVQAMAMTAIAAMLTPLVEGGTAPPGVFRPISTTGTPGQFRPGTLIGHPGILRTSSPSGAPGVFRPKR